MRRIVMTLLALAGCSSPPAQVSPSPTPTQTQTQTSVSRSSARRAHYLWTVRSNGSERAFVEGQKLRSEESLVLHIAAEEGLLGVAVVNVTKKGLSLDMKGQLQQVSPASARELVWEAPSDKGARIFTAFFAQGGTDQEVMETLVVGLNQEASRESSARDLYARLTEWKGEVEVGVARPGRPVEETGATRSTSAKPASAVTRVSSNETEADTLAKNAETGGGVPAQRVGLQFDWLSQAHHCLVDDHHHPVQILQF